MNVELLQDHWVNERKFAPGTVLDLPESAVGNLIACGAARAVASDPSPDHQPQPSDTD